MFALYKYRYIYIKNRIDAKLSFRLPFVGHDIPWIRPKIGPLIFITENLTSVIPTLYWISFYSGISSSDQQNKYFYCMCIPILPCCDR